jgi:uncharacterized protein with PQ loop repeat
MFTDPVSTLGAGATIYSIAAGSALMLQVRTMRRRGSSEDVSIAFLATTCGGYLIWLLYGIGISSMPLIVSDLIGLVCSLITVSVAWRLRRKGSPNPGRLRPARSKVAAQPVASTASAA